MLGKVKRPPTEAEGAGTASVSDMPVSDRHRSAQIPLFLTVRARVLHDPDLAEAITDRILERGRLIRLTGPSYRTRHLKAGLDPTGSNHP